MSPDEYESMLKDCLSRLKEYNFSLSDDLNAFHTLKNLQRCYCLGKNIGIELRR